MLKANRPKTLKHPAREWELRGILRCSCGWKMQTHTARRTSNGKTYSYYTCNQRRQYGKACGCTQRALPAEGLEELVWKRVERLLSKPNELITGLNRMIEKERLRTGGDPDEEARRWHRRLRELEEQRERSQDLAIEGLLDREELRGRLNRIEGQRKMAENELALTRHRGHRVRELEALKARWMDSVPMLFTYVEGAEHRSATPEEKRNVYRQHRVEVNIGEDGEPVLTGAFGEESVCTNETLSLAGLVSNFPLFSQARFGWGTTSNAFFFAFVGLCAVATQGFLIGRLQPRFGEGKLLVGGLALVSLNLILVSLVPSDILLYPILGLLALGMGLAIPSLTALISNRTPAEAQGRLMGGLQAILSFALILGPALAGLAFDHLGIPAPYLIGGALSVLALIVSGVDLLPSRRAEALPRSGTSG
jgi:hypothetical protein